MLQIKLNSSFFVIVLIISLVFTSSCASTATLPPTSESSQEEMVDPAISDDTPALEEPTENPNPDQPIIF